MKSIFALFGLLFFSVANAYEKSGTVTNIPGKIGIGKGVLLGSTSSQSRIAGSQINADGLETGTIAAQGSGPKVNNYSIGGSSKSGSCVVTGGFKDSTGLIHDKHTMDCNSSYSRPGGKVETCTCTGGGCKISYAD